MRRKMMKKLVMIIPLVIVLCFALSFQGKEAIAQVEQQNKTLVGQYVKAWNEGDFEALKEMLAPDYQYYLLPSTSPMLNRDGMVEFAMMMSSAFPDLNVSIEQTVAEDDLVVLRAILTGTHEGGDYAGIPATGNKIEVTSIITFRFENGKIVEEKELPDTMRAF